MRKEHPISDEVLELVNMALAKGEHWMVFNEFLYFIDKEDVYFFNSKTAAKEFANDHLSDKDKLDVIHFDSILDIYKEMPYGEKIEKGLVINFYINALYNQEGNGFTDIIIKHKQQQ